MKRLLIRMSTLTGIVVLGLIAIAQAQRGVGESATVATSPRSSGSAGAQGKGDPQPVLVAASGGAAPRELPSDVPMNPLRNPNLRAASPAIRTSAVAEEGSSASPQLLAIPAEAQAAPAMPAAAPPGVQPARNPFPAPGSETGGAAAAQAFPVQPADEPNVVELQPAPTALQPLAGGQAPPPALGPSAALPSGANQSSGPGQPSFAEQAPSAAREPAAVQIDPFAARGSAMPSADAGTAQALPAAPAMPMPQAISAQPAPAADPRMDAVSTAGGTGAPGAAKLEGPQAPQVTIQKFAPPEIQVGKPAKFLVKVQNTGQVAAQNVEIRDEVPRGTQLVATNPPASQGVRGELVWPLGTLQPGQEVSVEMEVMPVSEGEIGSVATVAFHAEASAKTTATKPQLVVKMVAPRQVLIGEEVVMSITVSNPGSGVAGGVATEERVPAGLQHPAGAELEYEIGELKPGESRQAELRMVAAQPGVVANVLIARGDANLRTEDRVEIEVLAPQLQVALDGPARRYLEREAVYTVSVSNPGTAPARQVELIAHLPTGMKFVGANNSAHFDEATQTVHWMLEELPANETGSVQLTTMPVVAGEQTIRVSGTADRGLTDEQQHAVVVEGIAAILFEVVDVEDPIEVNGETTYEIRVVNQGSKAATNVQLVADLPPGMRAVAAEGPTRHGINGNQILFEALSRLAPKADTTYRVRVQGVQPGDQRIRVQLQTDELKTPVTKEESTRVYADQ